MIGSQTLGAVSLGSVGVSSSATAGWTDARAVFGILSGASAAFLGNSQIDGDARAWYFIAGGAVLSTLAGANALGQLKSFPVTSLSFKTKADREGRFSVLAQALTSFVGSHPYRFALQAGSVASMKGRAGVACVAQVAAGASGTITTATGVCSKFVVPAGAATAVSAADGRSGATAISAPSAATFTGRSDYEEVTLVDPTVAHLIAKYRSPRIEVVA